MKSIPQTKSKLVEIMNKTIKFWNENNIINEWDIYKQTKSYGCLKYTYQLDVTPNGNLSFILYNFLGNFNGHYQFLVNPNTLDYKVRKYGDYGSLTTIKPTEDKSIYTKENLSIEQHIELMGHIAKTLHFVFYGDFGKFNRNCFVHDVHWQQMIYKKVAEDF